MATAYYIIKPTDELMQLMEKHNIKGYSWSEARGWTKEESVEVRRDKHFSIMNIKIAYLVQIISLHNPNNLKVYALLFGDPPVFSITIFDKWWTVERVGPGADYMQIMTQATAQQLKQIVVNDARIEEWLTQIIQYKEEQS